MVAQKAKSALKKVVAAKTKASSAVTGKPKTTTTKTTTAASTAKKGATKKTVTAVAEPKKTTAAKKVSAPAAEKTATAKKIASSKAKPSANKAAATPTPEERYIMVQTAAYYIAEQHGFQGRSDEHWAAAEREIAAKLGQ